MKFLPVCLTILFVSGSFGLSSAEERSPLDARRIEFYRQHLPKKPKGVGPTIADRAAWKKIAQRSAFAGVLKTAETSLHQPLPELTDDLFLDYSRTGNRTRYQNVLSVHHQRLTQLIYAECVENRGRFLPAIEQSIAEICDQKTWVLPAHDGSLKNFEGKIHQIDLKSSAVSWNLATVLYWLGEKLRPEIRARVAGELERRTFTPWESYVQTGKPAMGWPQSRGNWNAVCLSGVTGAALANIGSRERRAWFAAAAEKYIQRYLEGFSPDGYCSEGIGYWNYGFGHYILLAETLRRATGGKIDWLSDPRLKPIALAPVQQEILPDVYPAFADCRLGTKPDDVLIACLSRRLGLGLHDWEARGAEAVQAPQGEFPKFGLLGGCGDSAASLAEDAQAAPLPLRNWFPDAGILICRPADIANGLGAALKGGHNAEFHNHNDVGTFVVAFKRTTPIVDLGSVVYTRETFGRHRYENPVMNSFGHSVPWVADTLQSTGKSARAKVLNTEFTDAQDTLVLDIRSAYDLPVLKKLQRTFVFSREGPGKLTVIDEVEGENPQAFGTALITLGPWKQIDTAHLLLGEKGDAVRVEILAEGRDLRLVPQEIHADLPGKPGTPIRLGIELDQPVTRAKVTTIITPAE
jgi:hypothetical protein